MKKVITILSLASVCTIASATSLNFTAIVNNNLQGLGGADLATTDLVEVGTWDGATFVSFASAASDSAGAAGFFSGALASFDSDALVGSQLALQWSEAASGLTGMIYLDVSAGNANWSMKGGDGGGTDFNTNAVEVSDLTDASGTSLVAGATLVGATFAGTNAAGVPSFQLAAVPEPSTFAALAGLCALGAVALRRRRA